MTSLTLIVAATLTNGIGQGARLPWRLPGEMAYFARVTTRAPEGSTNAVIMGRNTWESIPLKFRPLKQRLNFVISNKADYFQQSEDDHSKPDGTYLCSSLQDAVAKVSNQDSLKAEQTVNKTFIIGGATVYKSTLDLFNSDTGAKADRILLTRILSPTFEDCDVFFPEFRDMKNANGEALWVRAPHTELEEWVGETVPQGTQVEKGVEYEFQMWVRIP